MNCLSLHIIRIKFGWLPLLLMLTITGCVTPFDLEINKYENLLVVDGSISNIPGSVYVKLNRTSSYTGSNDYPINSASVTLMDDLDNSIQLINTGKGEYVPSDLNFAGQIGRTYRIHIETTDSIIYESIPEEMLEPIALDEIKYVLTEGKTDNDWGVEIQVDVKNINQLNAYLYWEYAETWEFEVPYSSPYEPDSKICYRTVRPPLFLLSSNHNMIQKQFLNYPLYTVDVESNRLYRKYSVMVIQHTLSEQTYFYYYDLLDVNENRGSLFDNVPITLIGNIRNLSNPDQPVLGNFQVSAAVTKRVFIKNEDIADKLDIPSGYDNCDSQFAGIRTDASLLDSLTKAGWLVMDSTYNDAVKDTILTLTKSRGCFDCKLSGTNIKPEYWDAE